MPKMNSMWTGWGRGNRPFTLAEFENSHLRKNLYTGNLKQAYSKYLIAYAKPIKKPARKAPTRRSQAKPDLFKQLFG